MQHNGQCTLGHVPCDQDGGLELHLSTPSIKILFNSITCVSTE